MADFRQLKVWQKAHDVTLAVYGVTKEFPRSEIYGLTSQMRRCAISIGSNLAEGRGRDGDPEFARFIGIAYGSACELEYELLVAKV
jgi:four helix bundle protein